MSKPAFYSPDKSIHSVYFGPEGVFTIRRDQPCPYCRLPWERTAYAGRAPEEVEYAEEGCRVCGGSVGEVPGAIDEVSDL